MLGKINSPRKKYPWKSTFGGLQKKKSKYLKKSTFQGALSLWENIVLNLLVLEKIIFKIQAPEVEQIEFWGYARTIFRTFITCRYIKQNYVKVFLFFVGEITGYPVFEPVFIRF